MSNAESEENWDLVIRARTRWYDLRIDEFLRYKDLVLLFVRRDFVSLYKQTILGPLWFFLQPVITTLTFTVIFGNLAQISTDGQPKLLFYLSGITLWNYFSETLTKTSDTFAANASIFGKVYFPRIVVPVSIVISNLYKLGIQFLLFGAAWAYYYFATKQVHPTSALLLVPLLVTMMGVLGLAFGMFISSLTTKYRDLKFLVVFGVQLMMYASPVVYPLSIVPERYRWMIVANPVTAIIETFKYAFLGVGEFNWLYLGYSLLFTIVFFTVSLAVFHKIEKSFMDTV
jgi:lipopolysaccharide transport system permease protein